MKNIAIIIHKLYNGGAEHAACNLSLSLSSRFNTTLIAFDARNASYPHTDNTIDLQVPAAKSLQQRITLLPKRVTKLKHIKKERHIEASIALLPGPSMASALSRCRGEKVIMSVRNFLSMQEKSRIASLKTRFTASISDIVVAVSKVAAEDLKKNYGIPEKKLRVIYNSVDPDLLVGDVDPGIPCFADQGPVIVTMGRLLQQKGHWHLLRVMKKVFEAISGSKLLILGDGAYKDKLLTLAEELGISDRVYMPGYIASPYGYVRKSDLFVLPSLFEGMPNAMLEAMACGLPVISTDCPSGPREILAPDTSINETASEIEYAKYGIITPPMDEGHFDAESTLTSSEEAFARAIISMLSNDKLRTDYAMAAKERSLDFSPDRIAEQWAALCTEAMQ